MEEMRERGRNAGASSDLPHHRRETKRGAVEKVASPFVPLLNVSSIATLALCFLSHLFRILFAVYVCVLLRSRSIQIGEYPRRQSTPRCDGDVRVHGVIRPGCEPVQFAPVRNACAIESPGNSGQIEGM
jgi:hypothetical protein